MPPRTSLRLAAALAAAFLSAACGGGGGESPAPDTTPPTISSVTPANGATGVARGSAVLVTFSEDIDLASVTAATVVFEDALGGAVAYGKAFDAGTNVLTLTPTAALANYRGYTVQVGTGVKDTAGNGLAAAATYAFTTADDVLPAAPGAPAGPGAFATASPVSFGWTAATDDGSGVASYRLEVATATTGGTTVFSGDVGNVLSHDVAAADGQTLFARVRAVDGAANLGPWSSWSSAVAVDLTRPAISATAPVNGAPDFARAASLTVSFSERIDPATVAGNVSLRQGSTPVAVSATLDAAGTLLTIDPSADLANYAAHTLTIGAGLADLAGNALAAGATVAFTTADDVAPALAGGLSHVGAWDDASIPFTFGAASDDGSGVAGYEVEVALGPTPGAVVASLAPTASPVLFDATGFADGDVFVARIRAHDQKGNASLWSGWSDPVTLDAAAPTAPGTPAGPAAYALASPVHFGWTAASDAVSGVAGYLVEVASAKDGSGSSDFYGMAGDVRSLDLARGDGTHLFLRAWAQDALGHTSPWSGWSDEVIVDLQPPSAPGTPGDAGATTRSPAHFTWTAASDTNGVASYWLQVSTLPDGGGLVMSEGDFGDVLSADVGAGDGYMLYARVRAVDAAGRQGPWSPSSNGIRVDDTKPAAPGKPIHGGPLAGFDDASVPFSWTAATDTWSPIAKYVLEVSSTADFSSDVVTSDLGTATSVIFNAAGRDGQTLHARVHAEDSAGNVGPVSATSDGVTVDLSAPSVPGAPQDGGAAQYERKVHFFWAGSTDAGSGVSSYTVEVRDGGGALLATLTAPANDPSVDFDYGAALPLPVTLTARVRATDALGNASAFSAPSDGITITNLVPGTPGTPTEVPPAAYTTSTSITFSWSPPGAGGTFDRYVVQIGTTPGGNDVIPGVIQIPSTIDIVGEHGKTYYARVAARDSGTGAQGGFSPPSDGITVDTTPPGAPGTPSGTRSGSQIVFTWGTAADAESGISSYQVEVLSGASSIWNEVVTGTSFAFDVSGRDGQTISARVQATNGAGTAGPWSAPSAGIVVDFSQPWITRFEPWDGNTGVGTNTDVTIRFSEPMDRASVEAAFALSYGGTSPKNGYVFSWSADSTEVTIVPDTQDPVGATNVDLLPQSTAVAASVATTATDAAGNPLSSSGQNQSRFTTADETAPTLVGLSVGGAPSPVPAASVQGPFTLDLTFDEEMDPSRAGVSLSLSNNYRLEARYDSWGISNVVLGAGTATYALQGCPDVRVGDVVTVRDISPQELAVKRAAVTAVGFSGPCTFTVASSASGVSYTGGGSAAIPSGDQARPQWTAPAKLSIVFSPQVSLAAGSDTALETWDLSDASGNYLSGGRTSLQVAKVPGTDTTRPALLTSIPRAGGSAPGERLAILRFTEPLDRETLGGITASCPGCGEYVVEYQNDSEFGPLVFVMPGRAAPDGATVAIHVPATVKDLAGNALLSAVDLSYTVSASTDLGAPELLESLPPDGLPAYDVYDAQVAFVDGLSGFLDPIDATTFGPEDVRVEDEAGRLSRGWRTQADTGSAFLRMTQPRGPGLSAGWQNVEVVEVQSSAATGRATYTTATPHGMTGPGARVSVWMWNGADSRFNLWGGEGVAEIVSPTAFAVRSTLGDDSTTGHGNANVPTAKTYTVSLLGVPGANGIADVHGHAMAPQVFAAKIQPWSNRVPMARDLRDINVSAATSPLGRSLEIEMGVRDADVQTVQVSVAIRVGASDVPLASYTQGVAADSWGSGWYRVPSNGGGPPGGDSDPALAGLPSGLYPVAITLDDGIAATTYVRELYVWSPADAPALAGVVDGGTFRAMDGAHPPVVENGPSPAFRWTIAAAGAGAPDFLGVYVAALDGIGDRTSGYVEAVIAAPDAAELVAPTPLAPDVYLWTVVQQKFAPGMNDPRSSAWALDFGNLFGSLFVVGPDNDALGGAQYGAARTGFERSGSGALSGISDATGLWAFEPAGAADPVFVTPVMTDNTGATPPGSPQLFAYGAAGGVLSVTETVSAPGVPLPLPMRGVMRSDGGLFAVAQANEAVPSISAGAYRYATSGFGPTLSGRFSFVQLEARAGLAPVEGVGGSVGVARFEQPSTGLATVAITSNDPGKGPQVQTIPYLVDPDGRLSIDIGGPSGTGLEFARGYLGGAPGAEVAALGFDGPLVAEPKERTFWLLMARARDWTGGETEALVSGDYRFADISVELDSGSGQYRANGSNGTLHFDGAGAFTYAVSTPGGPMTGAGTYHVDPVAERVVVHVPGPSGGESTLTFAVGPDFDTLLGMSTYDANYVEALVVSR